LNVTPCDLLNDITLALDSLAFALARLVAGLILRYLFHDVVRHRACPPGTLGGTSTITVSIWVRLRVVSHILLVVL